LVSTVLVSSEKSSSNFDAEIFYTNFQTNFYTNFDTITDAGSARAEAFPSYRLMASA
jgi:hypothetical protein